MALLWVMLLLLLLMVLLQSSTLGKTQTRSVAAQPRSIVGAKATGSIQACSQA